MLVRSVGLIALVLGCSGNGKDADQQSTNPQTNTYNPNTQSSVGGTSSAQLQVDVEFTGTSGDNCSIRLNGSACAGIQYEPEPTPLDIYVMFDQTGSTLSCVDPTDVAGTDARCKKTRIDAIREAIAQFMADPESAGIGVGIGYFGQFPLGSTDCRDSAYATPAVAIGALPDSAGALMASLNSVVPTGETPTGAAIRGACSYAMNWKQTHVGHRVVMLLVTDGLPEAPISCPQAACCPTLDDAVTAALGCLDNNRGLQTYVLGVGPYLDNLQQIALAGGTKNAYLVGSGDVGSQVLQALNTIRSAAMIPCTLNIPKPPSGLQIAYDQINIAYADPACHGSVFPKVSSADACGTDAGWYYDDPAAPSRVELCPTSCNQVSLSGARLLFTVGCETVNSTIIN
jgi:hypothetical protein